MSRTTDWVIEMQESATDRKLAELLGIEYDELKSLEWRIDTDESKDGLIYNYRIEFYEDSPKEILDKIERLEDGCRVYLEPWELDDEYDYDEQFDAITENKNNILKFVNELANLQSLSSLEIPDETLKSILNRQIFISVISTMETYLSDTFINLTFDNEKFFRNFIETHPEFKQRKFDLKDIFTQKESLNETAKKVILDTIFHNLPTVSQMFKTTFEMEFPNIKEVYQDVLRRHDLVHRNGKTKEGENVETNEKAIVELIERVSNFTLVIEEKLKERKASL